MPHSPRVLVVGSFVQDLTWSCERFPRAGETTVGVFRTGPGGKGSNQAIAAGRAGVDTLFVGAVGRDSFAADAAAFYRSEKIACRLVEKPGCATGTAAILVDDSGQNEIVVALGANARLRKSDVPASAITSARLVVCQLESNLATTAHVLRTARRAGVTTVLNPAPLRRDFDSKILRDVDILIPNETEFVGLLSLVAPKHAKEVSEENIAKIGPDELHAFCRLVSERTVIVTLGSRGCLVSLPDRHLFVPAHKGIRVIDTTGAGDAFVGGFAAGLVRFDGDIERAAHFGNAVAALSVTKPGTAPSMPTAREIARFLRARRT